MDTEFEPQCEGDVKLYLEDFNPDLKLESKMYHTKIPAYNDELMERLYKICLEQFIKSASYISKGDHYRWIAASLPPDTYKPDNVAEIDDFTIEEDDHGNDYKKHNLRQLKGKFREFDEALSKVGSLVTWKKIFDKDGNLCLEDMLDQQKKQIDAQINEE